MKRCETEIECACGEKNQVFYQKPALIGASISKWTCQRCWSRIMTQFTIVRGGESRLVKQNSFILEPSDKLNRIVAARQPEAT